MSLKRAGLAILCFAVAFALLKLWPRTSSRPMVSVIFAFVLAVAVVSLAALGKTFMQRSDRAERGADAEVRVEHLLQALPAAYYTLHDLTFDGFNIDHIVIGPTGIFTVETKSHRGKITARGEDLLLNGRPFEKPVLKQAWSQAFTLRDLLKRDGKKPFPVRPILCFPNAFVQVRQPVRGVIVTSRDYLRQAILRQQGAPLTEQRIQEWVCALKENGGSLDRRRM